MKSNEMERNNENESQGVDEISRLLLQGWTMLADICPRSGCHMPLMRSRQGRTVCCSCRADVITSNSATNSLPHPGTSTPTEPTENGTHETVNAAETSPVATTAVILPTQRGAENSSIAIAPNAATTVNGDTIVPTSAGIVSTHVAPPMAKSSIPAQSSGEPSRDVQELLGGVSQRAVVPSIGSSTGRQQESLSISLGRRLLSGWTLTQDVCRCGMPLLRNGSDGRVECVSCSGVVEPGRTHVASGVASSHDAGTLDVASHAHGPLALRAGRAGQREGIAEAGTVVPTTGHDSRRGSLPPIGADRRNRVGVGMATGGVEIAGMVGVGGNASSGVGARRLGGRPAIGEIPTLEPRPTDGSPGAEPTISDAEDDVDRELLFAEFALAQTIRGLRATLSDTTDAASKQAICSAITEAANAIEAARRARRARGVTV